MPTVQATLSQGSTSFSAYVAYDGIEQSYVERAVSSVTTLDGVLHKAWVSKRVLKVNLRDMWHEDLVSLFSGVTTLASWTWLDEVAGPRTASMYLTGPTVKQTLAREGKTLCTGISFQLEER